MRILFLPSKAWISATPPLWQPMPCMLSHLSVGMCPSRTQFTQTPRELLSPQMCCSLYLSWAHYCISHDWQLLPKTTFWNLAIELFWLFSWLLNTYQVSVLETLTCSFSFPLWNSATVIVSHLIYRICVDSIQIYRFLPKFQSPKSSHLRRILTSCMLYGSFCIIWSNGNLHWSSLCPPWLANFSFLASPMGPSCPLSTLLTQPPIFAFIAAAFV